jgi:hypothetical protein
LFFLPFFSSATLELITAFWMVSMGILLMGRWPNGEPPAWAAGEARPWPTAAERRAEAGAERGGEQARERAANGRPQIADGAGEPEPEGVRSPANGPTRRRRRKRKARG